MTSPLIAIVGSYDPARESELGLKSLGIAPQAGEQLGRELARQGFRIIVYSSLAHTLEIDLVRGYLSDHATETRSIQVHFAQQRGQPSFVEEAGNEEKFEFRPDFNPDWEFSFYQSLARVDGMLLLGGGPSALIAGLVTIGHRKPLVACAAFGGSGEKIWHALRAQEYAMKDEDLALMAQARWYPDLAGKLVGLLQKQRDEFARLEQARLDGEEQRIKERRDQELRENSTINWHAVISTILFGVAAFLWPLAGLIKAGNPTQALCVVLLAPMIAGASGASIRVVLDWAVGVTRTFALSTYNQYILLRYAALGVVAGGLAGVSFVLGQLFASDASTANLATTLPRLVPFLLIIGFAAGLAAEVVLSNLRKSPPTVEIPVAKIKGG